ncbi:hypothetical protein [Serratia inhibens]|uniref:hypothetical protein n=1 Tax=Serratia inhibens TaxID=2338073 RepID=UPI0032178DFE
MKKLLLIWAVVQVVVNAASTAATAAVGVEGNATMNGRMLMRKSIICRMKRINIYNQHRH